MNKKGDLTIQKGVGLAIAVIMFLLLFQFVIKSKVFGSDVIKEFSDTSALETYGGANRFIARSSQIGLTLDFDIMWDSQANVEKYSIVVRPRDGSYPSDEEMKTSPLDKYAEIEKGPPKLTKRILASDFKIINPGTYEYQVRGYSGDKIVALAKSYIILKKG